MLDATLAPFWLRFGNLFGPFLGPKSGQVPSKLPFQALSSSKPWFSRKHLKTFVFIIFQLKMGPKTTQNWPKTTPRRSQKRSFFMLNFGFNFGSFGLHFGSILGPFWAPRSTQNRTKNPSKIKLQQHASTGPPREALRPPQELPRPPQDRPKSSQDHPKSLPNSPKRAQNPSKRLQDRPKKPPRPSQSNRFWIVLNNHYFLTKQKFWKFARSHQGDPRSCQDQRASEPPHIWASRPPSACRQLPRRDSRSANNLFSASGEAIRGTQRYFINALYPSTLSTHFIKALYHSTLSKHCFKAILKAF